jgi:hypothetical protein
MSGRIRLVQGDNLPFIKLSLTDPATGEAINVSDPDVLVRVYFRAAGAETILTTINCEKVDGGTTGQVRFNFPNGVLDVEPGPYEGEVEIDFDGQIQTVFEVLKFNVRSQFA